MSETIKITLANLQDGKLTNGMLADANISILEEQLRGGKSRPALIPAREYASTRAALRKGKRFGILTNYRTKEIVLCPKGTHELLIDLIGKGSADEFEGIYKSEYPPDRGSFFHESDTGKALMSAANAEWELGKSIRFSGFSIFESPESHVRSAEYVVEAYRRAKAWKNARRMAKIVEKLKELVKIPIEDYKYVTLPDKTIATDVQVQLMRLKMRGLNEKINL